MIEECDGCCPILSYSAAKKAEAHLRAGLGPVLLHAQVTRPYSHSLSDDHTAYRPPKELALEDSRDVLKTYPAFLKSEGFLTKKEETSLYGEVDGEVKTALKKALETPWPKAHTAVHHVLDEEFPPTGADVDRHPNFSGKEDIPMAQAINKTLKSECLRNPMIRMFGEDIADFTESSEEGLKGKGGVFKVTAGIQKATREGQVFNSPLAEANIIGRAVGQAVRGIKPVVEIQFFDYIWTAYMQMKNEMAVLRYRSGGDYTCPMVVRAPIGGYLRGGSIYHSQCGESLFTHIPGLLVAFPSRALDAMGLLRTAIRANDPVLFLEHKHLYYQGRDRMADPGEEFMIPFGKARVVKEGKDATIVAWGALVSLSLEAVGKVEESMGKSVEVIDPRTLAPFDMEAVKLSLSKTHRILICHEENKTSGFAGEISARINEECFESLDAPIGRIYSEDSPVPYCPDLENVVLPQVEDIEEKLKALLLY